MTSISLPRKSLLVFLAAAALAITAPAQTFTSVSFDGSDGIGPFFVALVQGPDGDFYGTTSAGGDLNCNPPSGCGTVFKVTPKGKLTTLHIFEETDGMGPLAGLILAGDKNFYGTTDLGGDQNCNPPSGCGTVFRITSDGVLTTVHTFESTEGFAPAAPLLQAADGNLYGTTVYGGSNSLGGTVFKMSLHGELTTIYNFCPNAPDCTDGNEPYGGLVQTTDGSFYGTTSAGGDMSACFGQGCGGVFRLTAGGRFAVVHNFEGPGGAIPRAGLVLGNDGSLYGTTNAGGVGGVGKDGAGTVFKIDSTGKFTSVFSFDGTDGVGPYAPLTQGTDGAFYGTTSGGDLNSDGGVFRITLDGNFTVTTLHSFCEKSNCVDGKYAYGGVLEGTNGTFYGLTIGGGEYQDGTIYSLNTGLGPFVSLVRNSGAVGSVNGILGQGFQGTRASPLMALPRASPWSPIRR